MKKRYSILSLFVVMSATAFSVVAIRSYKQRQAVLALPSAGWYSTSVFYDNEVLIDNSGGYELLPLSLSNHGARPNHFANKVVLVKFHNEVPPSAFELLRSFPSLRQIEVNQINSQDIERLKREYPGVLLIQAAESDGTQLRTRKFGKK